MAAGSSGGSGAGNPGLPQWNPGFILQDETENLLINCDVVFESSQKNSKDFNLSN